LFQFTFCTNINLQDYRGVGAGFLLFKYPLKLLVNPPLQLFENGAISQFHCFSHLPHLKIRFFWY
jgi:hypothetical protein